MKVSDFFTENDIRKIEKAVKESEEKTAGEIVVSLAYDSDPYPEVPYRAGLLFMIISWLALSVLALFSVDLSFGRFIGSWSSSPLFSSAFPLTAIISILSFGSGWLLIQLCPPFRRLLLSRKRQEEEVRQAALEVFLNENCHITEKHSGVLIYLTLFEKRVEIIADKGINDAVGGDPSVWTGIVTSLIDDIRKGKQAEGLEEAVRQCGKLLQEKIPGSKTDKNELSDNVRIKD